MGPRETCFDAADVPPASTHEQRAVRLRNRTKQAIKEQGYEPDHYQHLRLHHFPLPWLSASE